jgi:hypothetical protein
MDEESGQIEDFIALLIEQRDACIEEGNYTQAEDTHAKIVGLRKSEAKRKRETQKSQWNTEKLDLEEQNLAALEAFHEKWDKNMSEYKEKTKQIRAEFRTKQRKQKKVWEKNLRSQAFLKPKFSLELQDMRRIEQALARASKFRQANLMQVKANQLQSQEYAAQIENVKFKVLQMRELFKKRQTSEALALKERLRAGRRKLERKMQKEDQVLHHNLERALKELANHQVKDKRLAQRMERLNLAVAPSPKPPPKKQQKDNSPNKPKPRKKRTGPTPSPYSSTALPRIQSSSGERKRQRGPRRPQPKSARSSRPRRPAAHRGAATTRKNPLARPVYRRQKPRQSPSV